MHIKQEEEEFMNDYGFAACNHVFSFKCSGEVSNLIHAAERYGILVEKARERIEALCRRCENFPGQAKSSPQDQNNESTIYLAA
jgi:hypothetical protein